MGEKKTQPKEKTNSAGIGSSENIFDTIIKYGIMYKIPI